MHKIKEWLLKKELNAIKDMFSGLQEQEEKLEKRSNKLQEEKYLFEKEKQKEISRIISEYENRYKSYFNEKKERIDNLLKHNLNPWNKVWVLQYDNIKEVEITEIIIRKDEILITNNLKFYWEYYSTEKEAIVEYNKRIEALKK